MHTLYGLSAGTQGKAQSVGFNELLYHTTSNRCLVLNVSIKVHENL